MSECCEETTYPATNTKSTAAMTVALVGNPNCGKTTLFNALTGARQKVGNWPGVTVERKSGMFCHGTKVIQVVDLPGIYSLTLASDGAIDERIAWEFIWQQKPDVIINIVDAAHLERHLYLTLQLLERGMPIILALNMMDVARSKKISINLEKLSEILHCKIVSLEANNGKGIEALKEALSQDSSSICKPFTVPYDAHIKQAIESLRQLIAKENAEENLSLPDPAWFPVCLLENDAYAKKLISPKIMARITSLMQEIEDASHEEADILIADARYQVIQRLIAEATTQEETVNKKSWTMRIDHIVLNRFLGLPIFLGVMYFLFFFSINIGGAFQDFFDQVSQAFFVDGLGHWLTSLGLPTWLIVLLAQGVGKGINTTLTFIPVIGAMFLCLAFLEDSGYMARAAFVVDRLMRALGLPGKAFVPMIVGFGCNVPAVMGARTLENKRDRIVTIMMAPFMSCGARLAIYAIFTAAFFPHGGQNVVFALYLIGIGMAVFTGFMLRKTVLQGEPSPLVMELPIYHLPRIQTLCLHAWQRLKQFIFRAGKLIVPICVLIGVLNALKLDGSIQTGDGDAQSLLSWIGQWTTPIFAPMGIKADNWPATVGLMTGVLAKEVVVGTLNALYSQIGHLHAQMGAETFSLWAQLRQAFQSIPENFAALQSAFSNPVLAQAPINNLNQNVYGLMYQKFDGQKGAFAYLLFVLLYFPCVSTTAAMLRELHKAWAIFSVCWMTAVAYGAAVLFYQIATWMDHPFTSALWLITIASLFSSTFLLLRWYGASNHLQRSPL